MLSGIGPSEELKKFGIKSLVDLPVGKNLHDHNSTTLSFKLRHPEQDLVAGTKGWDSNPKFKKLGAVDQLVSLQTPDEEKIAAAKVDGDTVDLGPRSDVEIYCCHFCIDIWMPLLAKAPPGSCLSCIAMTLTSTSRGTVTLRSTNP